VGDSKLPATWVFNFVVAVQTWRGTEIGKWSAATETHPKGFYAAPVAETSQTSCLVIPPRIVYAMKNWDRTIEGVALAIESIIPVGFYRTVLKAWKRASAEIPFEFENLGYDHDYRLLEQIILSRSRLIPPKRRGGVWQGLGRIASLTLDFLHRRGQNLRGCTFCNRSGRTY